MLITYKRGREAKPKFTFRAEGTMLTPTRVPEFLGAKDFMEAYNEALMNEGSEPMYSARPIAAAPLRVSAVMASSTEKFM